MPLATLPTPHPPEKTWQQQEAEAGQRSPFAGTWVNRRILTYSETHPEIQVRKNTSHAHEITQNFNVKKKKNVKLKVISSTIIIRYISCNILQIYSMRWCGGALSLGFDFRLLSTPYPTFNKAVSTIVHL